MFQKRIRESEARELQRHKKQQILFLRLANEDSQRKQKTRNNH